MKIKKKTNIANNYFDVEIEFKDKNNKSNNKKIEVKDWNDTDFNISSDIINEVDTSEFNGFKFFNITHKNDSEIQGYYTAKTFTYYTITVSAKKGKDISEINEFLYKNKKDCKLQFFYIDISVDIDDYEKPTKRLINSLFLQIIPDFYMKKNVFFMNYHFKSDTRLIPVFENNYKEEEDIKAGFSRTEDYFSYKGVNSSSKLYDKEKYARLYIRVDNKKMEIFREYQNFLDFYAENTSLWFSIFGVLNFLFTFYNSFHANRSMSKKLFFFEEKEDNKFNFLKRKNSINSTESSIPRISLNDIQNSDIEDKDKNGNNLYSMPVIYTPKNIKNDNFIITSEKGLNREELNLTMNSIKKKEEKEKEIEKEKEEEKIKNPFSVLELIKVSIFTCCENKLKFKEKLIKEAMDIFNKKLDIYLYIKNMILIDLMYQVLIDNNNKDCINFLSRSLIYLNKKKEEEIEELNEFYKPTSKLKSDKSNKLYIKFKNLMEKTEKTEIEKKIISLYIDD